jgi:hypothetical protein
MAADHADGCQMSLYDHWCHSHQCAFVIARAQGTPGHWIEPLRRCPQCVDEARARVEALTRTSKRRGPMPAQIILPLVFHPDGIWRGV